MRHIITVLVLLAACSNNVRAPNESSSTATKEDVPEPASVPALQAQVPAPKLAPIGWRWNQQVHEVEQDKPLVVQLQKDRVFMLEGGWDPDRLTLTRRDDSGAISWSVDIKPDFVASAALAAYKDWLIVVRHSAISSGGTLLVFDQETGQEVHSADLHALGGVAHSKYRNEVQLQILGDQIVVFGKESQGMYVEVYAANSWKRVSNTKVDDTLASVEWQWSGPERTSFRTGPDTLEVPDAIYRYEPQEQPKPADLSKHSRSGTELWRTRFSGEGRCGRAAMLEHASRLFVVQYCSASNGAQLMVFDAASGVLLNKRDVVGLGPVAHSEYWNDVELKLLHEHVVIFGKEAAGRYIEVVDPETGAMVALQSFLKH